MPVVAILYNDLFVGTLEGVLTSSVVIAQPQSAINVSPVINIQNAIVSSPMFVNNLPQTALLDKTQEPQQVSAITFPTIYKERPKGSNQNHARNYPVIATDQRTIYT